MIRAAARSVLRLPERRRDVHHDPRSRPRPESAWHLRSDRRRRPWAAVTQVLILLLTLSVVEPAGGQVPTAVDIAACNDEAPQAVKAGAVSPTTGDHARAGHARGRALTTASTNDAGVESADPQIRGMAPEGAKNAAYQAAYRSCMRRKGF
jgi:hypothetical protein